MANVLRGIKSFDMQGDNGSFYNDIGLIYGEGLVKELNQFITIDDCRQKIKEYIIELCKRASPNVIWYKTIDIMGYELKGMEGVENEKIEEEYYLIDNRGVSRGLANQSTFNLELKMLSEVSEVCSNLNVLFPFVRDTYQLEKCILMLQQNNFHGKFGIAIDLLATVFSLEDFLSMGIQNITIDIDHFTTFTLGADKSSSYYNTTHPSIVAFIEYISQIKNKAAVELNIAGDICGLLITKTEHINIDNYIMDHIPPIDIPYERGEPVELFSGA